MKRLDYAGGGFVTGDREAAAILEYAAALANADRSATIPAIGLNEEGEQQSVELLVGPASEIIVEDSKVTGELPDPEPFLAEIRRRIDELTWRPPAQTGLIDEFDL
jgi:predicted phage gp36 major capsid-like protein